MNGDGTDAVDIAPFVDDTDDDKPENQQDSKKDDGQTPVEPNTPEAVEAENDAQSIGGDDEEEDTDLTGKITEKLDEVEKLIDKHKLVSLAQKVDGDGDGDGDDDNHQSDGSAETDNENERKSTMSYGADRRTSAEEALTQEEVQRSLKDQGIAFEGAKDEDLDKSKADEPSSSPYGDNVGGSTIQPGDIDETDKPVVKGNKKASTSSIMKLVDQYIKAGVIREADRYAKIDSMSNLTASAVENQSRALDAVMRATARKSARLNRLAIANANRRRAKRCADGDSGTTTDDKDLQATPSPVDPDGKADNGKTRDDDTKTSALIDRYGIARGSVTAHRGIYRWNLTAGSKKASRTHGIAKTMTGAIIAATNASGILGGLSVANDATIRRAAKRRDTKKAALTMSRATMAKRRSSALASKSHFADRPHTTRLSSAAVDNSDETALL